MRRLGLLLAAAVSLSAAPVAVTGSFANRLLHTNEVDVFGPNFQWSVDHGFNTGSLYFNFCQDAAHCEAILIVGPSQDGGPANTDGGFVFARNGPFVAEINHNNLPFVDSGMLFGWMRFRFSQSDWSQWPDGESSVTGPIQVTGRIGAKNDAGFPFMDHIVEGSGTMSFEIFKQPDFIGFRAATGAFEGKAEPIPEPATYWLTATAVILVSAWMKRRDRRGLPNG